MAMHRIEAVPGQSQKSITCHKIVNTFHAFQELCCGSFNEIASPEAIAIALQFTEQA